MNDVVTKPSEIVTPAELALATPVELTKQKYDEYCRRGHDCFTEAAVDCDLGLRMYAGLYENGKRTNRTINVNEPWSVRIWWSLHGSLRDCIAGYWCACAHFESIGGGAEFSLCAKDIEFYCKYPYPGWYVEIPGGSIDPKDCAKPFRLVTTLQYKTKCGDPGPIVGTCNLDLATFYYANKRD